MKQNRKRDQYESRNLYRHLCCLNQCILKFILATVKIKLEHAHDNCIQPSEKLTCSSGGSQPTLILRHFDVDGFFEEKGSSSVRVPEKAFLVYYSFGCQIQEESYIKTTWFTFPICGKFSAKHCLIDNTCIFS